MSSTDGKQKKRQSHPTAVADVLQGLLENSKSPLADSFARWRLERVWPEIVGETIAKQTIPCSYDRGTLLIWVRHSAWMQQLWYFQDPIKEKVNAYIGRNWVYRVKFTLERRAATMSFADVDARGSGGSGEGGPAED